MGGEPFGPWSPLSLVELRDAMAGAPFRWWVTGGVALDLHLGQSWREHDDLDIGIRRADARALHAHLAGWHPSVAAAGRLSPWDGRPLVEANSENNVWWRRDPTGPWILDTSIGDGDDADWIYRRDRSIRRAWAAALLHTSDGTPYLAPDLQLLFKSKDIREKDRLDAEHVIPRLTDRHRASLRELLPAAHPWQAID